MAAVLKAHALVTLPILEPGPLRRWQLVTLVGVELVLGSWLVLGRGAGRTWSVTLAVWLTFFAVAAGEALSGEKACHCFGRVSVNPWYTASFDLAAVVILCVARPDKGGVVPRTPLPVWRRAALGLSVVAGASLGGWILGQHAGAHVSREGLIYANGTFCWNLRNGSVSPLY